MLDGIPVVENEDSEVLGHYQSARARNPEPFRDPFPLPFIEMKNVRAEDTAIHEIYHHRFEQRHPRFVSMLYFLGRYGVWLILLALIWSIIVALIVLFFTDNPTLTLAVGLLTYVVMGFPSYFLYFFEKFDEWRARRFTRKNTIFDLYETWEEGLT